MSEIHPKVQRLAGKGVEVRPIPGHEGYFATENGKIISTWTHYARINPQRAKIIKGATRKEGSRKGYRVINLRDGFVPIGALVLLTFKGHPPEPNLACGCLDGDRGNTRASNLIWKRNPRRSKLTLKVKRGGE